MKVAVVYWSGSGNTERMAKAVACGIARAGATAEVFFVDAFPLEKFGEYDAFALGCPAMGAEVLEEDSFEPFFAKIEAMLKGKPVALFGSYGWGDGAWMRDWEERARRAGAILFEEGLILRETPDETRCEAFGEAFLKR